MVLNGPLVAVIGPDAAATDELNRLAEELGRELAAAGFGVVCGGRGGVMEAVCRGAKVGGGLTVGILPSTDRAEANKFVDIVICTGMGEARNLVVVASGQIVIAVGGEWGTLSEIALAQKINRPVITLAGYGWRIERADPTADPLSSATPSNLITVASPTEAVQLARRLLNL